MDAAKLMVRAIFNNDHHVNHTCPIPDESGPTIVPLASGLTSHHLLIIIAGAMTAFACVLSFGLIMAHAMHYSSPPEQKQIIRITFTIPFFSVVALIIVVAQTKAIYLMPLIDLYESLALSAFFFLLCAYVSPYEDEREQKLLRIENLGMYHRAWFFVFQQPVVMLGILIATDITQAVGIYCATSNKPAFAHVWLSAFKIVTSAIAIINVLRFYSGTKSLVIEQKPLLKLVTFKLIVFLQVVQNAVFSYLTSGGHLKANDHLTFLDISVGVPSLLICAEMVIFSIAFQFAYPVGPYLKNKRTVEAGQRMNTHYVGGVLGIKALLDAVFVSDLVHAILKAPSKLQLGRSMDKSEDEGYGPVMGKPSGRAYGY